MTEDNSTPCPKLPVYKTRPETTELQTDLADLAVCHIRNRGTVLANAIADALTIETRVSLVGHPAETPDDVATIGQVVRNGRLEVFHYLFTKDGIVVAHAAFSSRLPGATAIFDERTDLELGRWIQRHHELYGSDSFWMLHNHPCGKATPSQTDIKLTRIVAALNLGLLGHVIIDSNEYAVIDAAGESYVIEKLFGEEEILVPSKPHALLGRPLKTAKDLVSVGKDIQSPKGWIALVSCCPTGKVRGISLITAHELLNMAPKRAAALISRFAKHTGGYAIALVVEPEVLEALRAMHPEVLAAIESRLVVDIVTTDGHSLRSETGAKPDMDSHLGRHRPKGKRIL